MPTKKSARQSLRNSKLAWERTPKSKEEWMAFMVNMIKQKSQAYGTSDKDIEGTIKHARTVLFVSKEAKIDPDMPDCYYWNERKVAEWINTLGFPEVKEMFLHNNINGRRLVIVDASALNQMGMSDLGRMRQVTNHIRSILETPPPNALRALMRLVPWELYLKAKARTGVETDELTFKAFCNQIGFPYAILKSNKCAKIPCVCHVELKMGCKNLPNPHDCIQESLCVSDGSSSSESSLKYCPSVENVVRRLPLRDQVIRQVLDELTKSIIDRIGEIEEAKEEESKANMLKDQRDRTIELKVRKIFDEAYAALGIDKPHLTQSRVEFVASVAEELVEDIIRTREILADIDTFQAYMDNSLDPEIMQNALDLASEFLDEVSAISTMLTLGQLELEALIKEAPCIQSYVDNIIQSAEDRVASKDVQDGGSNSNTKASVKTLLSTTRSNLKNSRSLKTA